MNVYLLVAFIAVLVFAVAAGLIVLDHYFENKRNKKIGKIICKDVIPAAEYAMETYTNELMNSVTEMTKTMVENLKEI